MFLFVKFISAQIFVLVQLNFDTGELVSGNQLTITNVTKLEFSGLSPKIWNKVDSV